METSTEETVGEGSTVPNSTRIKLASLCWSPMDNALEYCDHARGFEEGLVAEKPSRTENWLMMSS